MTKKTYQFAIVGCGRIAQRHAGHMGKFGKLRAVCDVFESSARAMGEEYDAVPYTSLEEMLEKEGLVAGHAYSIIQAREVTEGAIMGIVGGTMHRLLQKLTSS